jgi:hypothetical protein
MKYEWDDAKAAANRRKHGVSFDEAEDMFTAAAFFNDFDHSEVEPRYLAIGFSSKGRMLTVSFTRPVAGVYRIISARKASKRERERYAKAKRENR